MWALSESKNARIIVGRHPVEVRRGDELLRIGGERGEERGEERVAAGGIEFAEDVIEQQQRGRGEVIRVEMGSGGKW